jgi:hypothetical protein
MSVTYIKYSESLVLEAAVIETILLSCINKVSIYILALAIQKIISISISNLKRYLFYLIDYGLISYKDQKKLFIIENGEFGLLDMIDAEKRQEGTDIIDITITFENI